MSPINWSGRLEKGANAKELAKRNAQVPVISARAEMEEPKNEKKRSGKKARGKKTE